MAKRFTVTLNLTAKDLDDVQQFIKAIEIYYTLGNVAKDYDIHILDKLIKEDDELD